MGPIGAPGVEVTRQDRPPLYQPSEVDTVDCIPAALRSCSVVDVDDPSPPHLLPFAGLPHVQALHTRVVNQVGPFFEDVRVEHVDADS